MSETLVSTKRPTLVIATANPGKAEELRALLAGVHADLKSLTDFPHAPPPPPEEGDTYEAIALGKARYYAGELGMPCLADDSGLEIFALGGWPGLNSARPAGDQMRLSDSELVALVLKKMEPFGEEPERRARFVCAVAYVDPSAEAAKREMVYRGSLYGLINKRPKGKNGFGYDPVFYIPDVWKTLAQMSPAEKNRFSHRRNAIVFLKPQLIHEQVKAEGYAV